MDLVGVPYIAEPLAIDTLERQSDMPESQITRYSLEHFLGLFAEAIFNIWFDSSFTEMKP